MLTHCYAITSALEAMINHYYAFIHHNASNVICAKWPAFFTEAVDTPVNTLDLGA